jgi:transcription initiation factor TFIIIB Brf1 subunit/transcription initiation factor TFIIB
MNTLWENCPHEWEEIDSQFSSENYGEVVCKLCGCHGEIDYKSGKIYWPAT